MYHRLIITILSIWSVTWLQTSWIVASSSASSVNQKYSPTFPTRRLPFTLGVRDSLMIAHSFHNHPSFGPAGGMHGATYTCDVEFSSQELEPTVNWVMDIGLASDIVSQVLSKYNLKNLDQVFPKGEFTTTEFMARQIYHDIVDQLAEKVAHFEGRICVKLWESHKAWASYEGDVHPTTSSTTTSSVDIGDTPYDL